ncbi:LuxR C-terminal-related transcriptional regulator [Streptomyces lateritius]|uniref:LuxR C-terminal-related transcriptional regulator n=1 Tax=Streptomyces lateritius TaxID=67313 RepID=UPI001C8C43A8|nr:LuxR C-terminal-related transcriptional regulator [Streptomyces lateritius]MBX9425466.1 LuxR C-terminal-related transcriptional regulator [Streptomyces lateritius]
MSATLHEREIEFLERLGRGETGGEIAAAWHMELSSVRTVAERLRRKLGARTNEHAVLLACQAGILDGRPRRHGDHAGYEAHRKRGETPCDHCREGERAHRRAMKVPAQPNQEAA